LIASWARKSARAIRNSVLWEGAKKLREKAVPKEGGFVKNTGKSKTRPTTDPHGKKSHNYWFAGPKGTNSETGRNNLATNPDAGKKASMGD